MTDIIKVVGGGDSEPNLEELGLRPYNSEELVIEQQSDVIEQQSFGPAVSAILQLSAAILKGVLAWLATVGKDREKREAFTKTFVEEGTPKII